jgi:hypothetical protein
VPTSSQAHGPSPLQAAICLNRISSRPNVDAILGSPSCRKSWLNACWRLNFVAVESRCGAVALGSNISVPASFVWRCLTGSTMAPFPHLAHRTGHAALPHPALGQDLTPSSTARRAQACSSVRARSAREWIAPALALPPDFVLGAQPTTHPRSVRFNFPTSIVVSCPVPARSVSAWIFSTARLMLFFDGRCPKYAWPALAEYIRPNVYPRKSNCPSGTPQIRVFSSFTVSFSLTMISRSRCNASSALSFLHRITRSSA